MLDNHTHLITQEICQFPRALAAEAHQLASAARHASLLPPRCCRLLLPVALRNLLIFIQAAGDPAASVSTTSGWAWTATLTVCGYLQPISEHVWIL